MKVRGLFMGKQMVFEENKQTIHKKQEALEYLKVD